MSQNSIQMLVKILIIQTLKYNEQCHSQIFIKRNACKKINATLKFCIVDLLCKMPYNRLGIITAKGNMLVFLIKEMLMKKIDATIKFCIVNLLCKYRYRLVSFRNFDKTNYLYE